MISFPLNCWWRLWCNILHNAVDTTDTITDFAWNVIKELVLKIVPAIQFKLQLLQCAIKDDKTLHLKF
jgi:hypothetical protein